jgi:hypothetical protein
MSLVRILPSGYGGEPLDWAASENPGGTPGTVGSAPGDWRAAFFTTAELSDAALSGVFADADGDKMVNALEYLLGGDLRDNASRRDPEVTAVELGGEKFAEFRFTLRDGVNEFLAEIEVSTDLQNWGDAAGVLTLIGATPNGDGTSTLTYRGDFPIDPDADLYFRVRAVEVR